MTTQTAESLESRVTQFRCLELPGQPMSMHMGTSYLVNDLWGRVKEQAAEIERLNKGWAGANLLAFKHSQEIERLRSALERAADDIESWGAYASGYFQDKWNLQGDIDAARAALEQPK